MRALGAAVLMAFPAAAHAQAWTRDQGSAYVNLSVTALGGDRAYDSTFETIEIVPYRQTTISFYGELGIVDRWLTAVLVSELYRQNELEGRGRTAGLGDMRLGLFSGILVQPFRLSAGLVVGVPTGDSSPQAGDEADAEARLIAASLPTGDGELDFEPQLLLGYSLGAAYFLASGGYAIKTRGYSDAVTYKFEAGVHLFERLRVTGRFFGVESLASSEEAAAGFAGLGDGVTHTSFGLELYARIVERFGISIAADTAVRARGIVAGTPIKLAVSWEN
jgi:hypothetical protein